MLMNCRIRASLLHILPVQSTHMRRCNIHVPPIMKELPSMYGLNIGLVSYLDVGITINGGHCNAAVYDKRDNFNFRIVNFPFMSSNIPAGPCYRIYISQLERICNTCDVFAECMTITTRLMKQDFFYNKLVRSFKKIYLKYIHFMDRYNVSL